MVSATHGGRMGLVRLRRRGDEGGLTRARRRLSTLLVELPFKAFERPSLGLGLLRASLEAAGYPCGVRYMNLEYAAHIGPRPYMTIASLVPHELLLGDVVFAPALDASLGAFG